MSIIPGGDGYECFLCHRPATDRHHCLHGSRRKKAEEWGLTVNLCRYCHSLLHDKGVNDLFLEQTAQMCFEENYGHDKWMQEFGKDYL